MRRQKGTSPHVPIRSCCGCGVKTNKWHLLRMVLSPQGQLLFDPRQKQPGRGCYICRKSGCLQQAISRRRFQRAFRRPLAPIDYPSLIDQFAMARTQSILHLRPSQRLGFITQKLEDHFGQPKWQGCKNPLDALILTVLSQNTNDNNRDRAFAQLQQRFPDWQQVMTAEVAEIAAAIHSAGLANQKSARIRDILHWVHDTYGTFNLDFLCQEDPEKVKEIFLQLKGIGIKTISVVLMICCGADIFPVDTHIHRISRRLGFIDEKTSAEKAHIILQPLVPKGKSYSLHMNLLKLGRTICTARKPLCPTCPIQEFCPSCETY